MLKSLKQMNDVKINLNEDWIIYLYKTKEKNYNVNNVKSLNEINNHSVFNYVKRTLEVLNNIVKEENIPNDVIYYVEETLKWSEVAKTGRKSDIKIWKNKKYDLFCHNIGSYQIYLENNNDKVVATLIKIHGLIGQYLKGEVNLNKNIELFNLIKDEQITKEKLKTILIILNRAIIEAISKELYDKLKDDILVVIHTSTNGDLEENI